VLVVSAAAAALRVLALDAADRVLGAPLEPGGAGPGVRSVVGDRVELDLAGAPADLGRLLIIAAAPAAGPPLRSDDPIQLTLQDEDGIEVARYVHAGSAGERALILGEVYARAGLWKLRAVGQGHAGGLPELLAAHGGAARDVPPIAPAQAPAAPAQPAAEHDPGLDAQRQLQIVTGIFEDAARATAGYRSAIDFAERRRERELAQLLDDPRRRGPDDPARAGIAERFDALAMQATADHHRGMEQLRGELARLDPALVGQFARWDSPTWRRAPAAGGAEAAGALAGPEVGLRVGDVVLPEAPQLRVPLILQFPFIRPLWIDGDADAVAAMARGIVVRLLAACPPGGLRVRAVGAGVAAAALRGADSAGQPLRRLGARQLGAPAGAAGPDQLDSPGLGQDDAAAAVRDLAHRADLLDMARSAGADALPADLFAGHVALLWGAGPDIDDDSLQLLAALRDPAAGVSVVLLGDAGGAVAAPLQALRIVAGEQNELTDGWAGQQWALHPDPGPTDAQLAALPPLV